MSILEGEGEGWWVKYFTIGVVEDRVMHVSKEVKDGV